MAAAGVEIVEHIDRLSVMGLVEVLRHLPLVRRVLRELGRALQARRPRLVILIDYPDFNIRVARLAHEAGVRVMYYISPQVWAWRAWRARLLARLVDRMIVVFAFEVPFYERFGLRADFVGHPLLDVVAARTSREALLERAGLRGAGLLLGLLPGSRVQEVRAMLPTMLHAAARLQAQMPQLEVIIGAAPTVPDGSYYAAEANALHAPVVREMTYDVMRYSDAVIAASGTATLECAILGTPLAAVYNVARDLYRRTASCAGPSHRDGQPRRSRTRRAGARPGGGDTRAARWRSGAPVVRRQAQGRLPARFGRSRALPWRTRRISTRSGHCHRDADGWCLAVYRLVSNPLKDRPSP
jgi:lipid-A-disaccharide synthase